MRTHIFINSAPTFNTKKRHPMAEYEPKTTFNKLFISYRTYPSILVA
ncbi:hypothetical protein LBKG_00914 [Lactobacillus crispatus CTV-05]|nr:hypothetical protein LBKG_00914 [Lactobacillus crispatus CTV-05]